MKRLIISCGPPSASAAQLLSQVFNLIHYSKAVLVRLSLLQLAETALNLVEFVQDKLSPTVLGAEPLALVVFVVICVVLVRLRVGDVPCPGVEQIKCCILAARPMVGFNSFSRKLSVGIDSLDPAQ